jgi:hypothetical protein
MAAKTPNFMGDYNKFMGAFNKYSPYLSMFNGMTRGGNLAKNAVETGLDYGMSQIPGYGQAYQGVKMFNQMTGGGVNFNKMLGVKNPLTQLSSSLFGRKKTTEEEQAADPEYAKYMGMLSDMQNSSATAERSALEKRAAIQPMQEKAVNDYMDMLQNGLSSRQLAPVYAAGEARNRAIGAGAEAGLMSQVANRGVSGGVRAGLEAAVQGNRNALSADLNSRITQQQIAARPGMLGQAANLTMSMENQAQQELAQAAMNRMNASQIGLSAYNANQQNERYKEQLEDARRTARNTEMGALAGRFGPDIVKGIQGLLNRGKLQPGARDAYTPDTSIMDAVAAANPEGFGIDYSKNVPTPTEMPDQILGGFQLPTMGRDAASPMFEGGREMVVEAPTENMLNRQYPMAVEGQNYPGPNGAMFTKRGGRWVKSYGNPSIGGLNQRPFDVGNVRPDLTDVLDKTGGMLSNTSNYAKFW